MLSCGQPLGGRHNMISGIFDETAKLFPNLFGQASTVLVLFAAAQAETPLKVGVVLCGGQALGGHNVIVSIFDEAVKLFLNLFGQPSVVLVPTVVVEAGTVLKLGIVLSGVQSL